MYWGAVRDDEVLDPVLGGAQGEGRRHEFWAILEESSKLVGRGGLVDDVVELVLGGDKLITQRLLLRSTTRLWDQRKSAPMIDLWMTATWKCQVDLFLLIRRSIRQVPYDLIGEPFAGVTIVRDRRIPERKV